jgi:hypothetical protein
MLGRPTRHPRTAVNHSRAIPALIILIGALVAFSTIITISYVSLRGTLPTARAFVPLIRFYPNYSSINSTGLIPANTNQTFCPANAITEEVAQRTFVYPYYTVYAPGGIFRYSIAYNSTNYTLSYPVVEPPFALLSYNTTQRNGACAAYPGAKTELNMYVRAPPNSTFIGSFSAVIYQIHNNK